MPDLMSPHSDTAHVLTDGEKILALLLYGKENHSEEDSSGSDFHSRSSVQRDLFSTNRRPQDVRN